MKKEVFFILILLLIPFAYARDCEAPTAHIKNSVRFCGENYYPKYGINIEVDNMVVDCGNAVLQGEIIQGEFNGIGISIIDKKNITIKDCKVAHYETGFLVKNSTQIKLIDSSMIRNKLGLKLVNSNNNFFERNNDISLEEPVKAINSSFNVINYVNKDIENDICRTNICNEESDIIEYAEEFEVQQTEQNSLLRTLNDALRMFLDTIE